MSLNFSLAPKLTAGITHQTWRKVGCRFGHPKILMDKTEITFSFNKLDDDDEDDGSKRKGKLADNQETRQTWHLLSTRFCNSTGCYNPLYALQLFLGELSDTSSFVYLSIIGCVGLLWQNTLRWGGPPQSNLIWVCVLCSVQTMSFLFNQSQWLVLYL